MSPRPAVPKGARTAGRQGEGSPSSPRPGAWVGWAVALCVGLGGCANALDFFAGENAGPPFRDGGLTMERARATVQVGQSRRADVEAALGPATVVRFHSGYEVWAYRGRIGLASAGPSEFIVLFSPDGVVRKTRIRWPAAS